VGALSDALKSGFEKQGALLLGGDVTVSRPHTRATVDERRWIDSFGRSSETATMRTMGRTINGEDQTLIELKAVDAAYPLVGAVTLETGEALDAALARGVVADPMLLERLSLKAGDRLRIGYPDACADGEDRTGSTRCADPLEICGHLQREF
jgi:putative ABC transport system permease protein